jgi:glycosyltransferase involved in cell wall biosynthesis
VERRLLSIVIPAFQEERTIGEVLRQVSAIDTEASGFDKEILVCDDGSTDRTVEVVRGEMARDPRIRLAQHPDNRGKGAAIRTALGEASGEFVLIQDADLEYEVTDYPSLLAAVNQGADVVYGSRFLTRDRPEGMRIANYLANRILTISANLLYGLSITDEATCFKVFRTDLLRELQLECEGFEFCPEVTAKLGRRKVRIAEVPIHYRARNIAEGKKVRWTDGAIALWVLVKHRLSGRRRPAGAAPAGHAPGPGGASEPGEPPRAMRAGTAEPE